MTSPPLKASPAPERRLDQAELPTPQAASSGVLETYLERKAPPVVAVTYGFDLSAQPPTQMITLRLVGRRLQVAGQPQPGDRFDHEETFEGLVAGGGPITVTTKIRDVNPGDWTVDAKVLTPAVPDATEGSGARPGARSWHVLPAYRAGWSWRRWKVMAVPASQVRTCPAPFVRSPAVVLGSWMALVVTGIILGLVTQSLILSTEHLQLGHVLTVSLPAVLAGIVGGKAWYMLLHRRERLRGGWALQGFIAGVVMTAPLLLWLFAVPIGPYLDAAGPALMIGAAVGRLGCFLTGCCAGRPTASRWGVWSSNRRIGARRIPTQLLESALALTVGMAVLAVILRFGSQHGGLFVASIAAYTLVRQTVLLLREERRRSRRGPLLIAAAATGTMIVDVMLLALM